MKQLKEFTSYLSEDLSDFFFNRLLEEGICHEKNIPSISSINRIIRDKSIFQRRGLDFSGGDEVMHLSFCGLY